MKALFFGETKTEVLPQPPPNPTNSYQPCAPYHFLNKPVPCYTILTLPPNLLSESAQLCSSSSGNLLPSLQAGRESSFTITVWESRAEQLGSLLHLQPREGGICKDLWCLPGMAPVFCNH